MNTREYAKNYARMRRSANPDYGKDARIKYEKLHKEARNKKCIDYYYANRDHILKQKEKQRRSHGISKRSRLSIEHKKIRRSLSYRVWSYLKNNKHQSQTMLLLGCTMKDFLTYLESKFQKGMSFENYGKWHIDHIKPCCAFDLLDPKQQKACFHYTNLQPLWAKDNLKKGSKI